MEHALARQMSHEEAAPPGAPDIALRLALEEARQLAAQAGLLALNAAFESAGARREAEVAGEMDALAGSAGQAVADAEQIAAAVALVLQQIRSAADLSAPL